MKNQTLSFILLLTFSFMLMLMASYLSSFQTWLTFSQPQQESPLNHSVSGPASSGLRSISSVTKTSPPPYTPYLSYTKYIEPTFETSVEIANPKIESVNNPTQRLSVSNAEEGGGEFLQPERTPSFIQYNDALVIEVPKILATPSNLKRVISKVLLSPFIVKDAQLLSADPIQTQWKPWFYKQVINQYGQPIRYPAAANDYAKYLLKEHAKEVVDTEGTFVVIQIPRVQYKELDQIEKYKPWVDQYTAQFDVPKDLVFAIIEVESGFNPRAVSKSNALGLMQIKANAAGRDVYKYVDGKKGQPNKKFLFDAQNNIRMGVAYMGLLKHDYLKGVRNPRIKEMLAISSYNGGISRTLKLFASTPEKAIARVNQLHPKGVYRTLRYEHTSTEARRYLDKVLTAKKRYSDLFG